MSSYPDCPQYKQPCPDCLALAKMIHEEAARVADRSMGPFCDALDAFIKERAR